MKIKKQYRLIIHNQHGLLVYSSTIQAKSIAGARRIATKNLEYGCEAMITEEAEENTFIHQRKFWRNPNGRYGWDNWVMRKEEKYSQKLLDYLKSQVLLTY
jgi:hypothetical protein